jgi:hypothetical protein
VRYRHLQPLVVATMALEALEIVLDLLQRVSIHLSVDSDEAQRLHAFLASLCGMNCHDPEAVQLRILEHELIHYKLC